MYVNQAALMEYNSVVQDNMEYAQEANKHAQTQHGLDVIIQKFKDMNHQNKVVII